MGIKRKEFCGALLSGSALLILQGCGGGSDYGSAPAPTPGNQCGASGNAIAGNHAQPHVLTIARADLDATTPQTYHIMGLADHDHTVTFDVAQLGQLKSGMSVAVTSSQTGHTHSVTATCI
ncbi:MAG: hypothetical protein ABI605_00545 [Rhizobacter sp.]